MNSKKKYIFIILVLLLFVVGCNETTIEEKYTINFDTNTSEIISSIEIDKPTSITLPVPVKKGYIFNGWYPSEDYLSGTVVTNETVIGKNITLHAKWEPIKITLSLDLQGGYLLEETNTNISMYTNEFYDFPRVYLNEHMFLGWYVEDKKVDKNTEFLEDTTVTAKFKALSELQPEYALTLNLNEGTYFDYHVFDETKDSKHRRFYEWGYDDTMTPEFNNLVAEFCYDFYSFSQATREWDYFSWNFFNISESRLIGSNGFCGNSNYYNKWKWLFEYIATVANPENKPYFEALLNGDYINDSQTYGIEQAAIRIELAGFLVGYQQSQTVGKNNPITVTSQDYSNPDILYGFIECLNPTKYITGEGLILLTPHKENYQFVGWYDNPEFKGEKITEILYNDFGDKGLYAKWE